LGSGLGDELTCSICLNMYMDPVTLTCGHSFCRTCIVDVLDTQNGSGAYKCPECRAESQERPTLVKTTKLFRSTHSSGVAWVVSARGQPRIKVLEYYCCEDAACICVSCSLAGEHRGHQVETLREEAEKRVQNLEELRRQVQEKAAGVTERVTALIRDIRKQLEALEKRVLSEISRQEEQVSLRVSDLIQQLEIKEELCRKMGDIEELCDMTDTLTVLQRWESDRADYCDTEDTETHDIKVHDVGDLDVGLISVTFHAGLTGILTGVTRRRRVLEASDMLLDVNTASDMLLDVNTAHNCVSVSEDLKTVSWSGINQRRPETPERFRYYRQVLSSSSFSSGRLYWEVEGSGSGWWIVRMAYPSIERGGEQSLIGNNKKSWGLWKYVNNQYYVMHDNTQIRLPQTFSCQRLGIFLDYEAGRLSFYELCDPIRHLHTFTAAFTEPLGGMVCRVRGECGSYGQAQVPFWFADPLGLLSAIK
uniref:Uncharacterized protein n=1 Tax=Leptobrachium leishanense TaxID=445787 RepID=A0A8C5WCV6_9ANUR